MSHREKTRFFLHVIKLQAGAKFPIRPTVISAWSTIQQVGGGLAPRGARELRACFQGTACVELGKWSKEVMSCEIGEEMMGMSCVARG